MLPFGNSSWALQRCRGHEKVAQDFEVSQGLFVPIPACPLNVPLSGPHLPPSIKSVSGKGSQGGGFHLQDI